MVTQGSKGGGSRRAAPAPSNFPGIRELDPDSRARACASLYDTNATSQGACEADDSSHGIPAARMSSGLVQLRGTFRIDASARPALVAAGRAGVRYECEIRHQRVQTFACSAAARRKILSTPAVRLARRAEGMCDRHARQ